MNILIIFLTLIFTVFCYYNFNKSLYLIIFLLPSYLLRFKFFGVPMTLLEVIIIINFIIWIIKIRKENYKRFRKLFSLVKFLSEYFTGYGGKKAIKTYQKIKLISPLYYKIRPFILFFLFSSIVAFFVSPNLIKAAGLLKAYFIEPVLFFIVFISVVDSKEKIKNSLYVLGVLSFLLSIIGIVQYFFGYGVPSIESGSITINRITSIYDYPNALGLFIAPIIAIFIVLLIDRASNLNKNKNNFVYLLFYFSVIISGLFAVVLSRTEAAVVALTLMTGVVLFLYSSKTRIIASALIILFFISILIFPNVGTKIEDKVLLRDFSGTVRIQIYKESYEMLKTHLIFGAGLSGYQDAVLEYHKNVIWIGKQLQPVEIYLYPHNIFLNFWSELGMLGVLSFGILLFKFYFYGLKKFTKVVPLSILTAMSVVLIHGLVDVPYFKNDLAVLFWLFVAIIFVYYHFDNNNLEGYNKNS